jgi:hypothetical protein
MCKSQRDVLVEQQRSRRERKHMKDTLKILHNHHGFEPPRSPPSPETKEPEIPSVDSMVAQLGSEGYFQQYAHHYGYQVPNPPPPPMGPPTSGQSVVSRAYHSLFGNIDGNMCSNFLFISIYHSFSSSKIQILSKTTLLHMVVLLQSMAVLLQSTVVSDAQQRLFSKFLVMDDKGGEEYMIKAYLSCAVVVKQV